MSDDATTSERPGLPAQPIDTPRTDEAPADHALRVIDHMQQASGHPRDIGRLALIAAGIRGLKAKINRMSEALTDRDSTAYTRALEVANRAQAERITALSMEAAVANDCAREQLKAEYRSAGIRQAAAWSSKLTLSEQRNLVLQADLDQARSRILDLEAAANALQGEIDTRGDRYEDLAKFLARAEKRADHWEKVACARDLYPDQPAPALLTRRAVHIPAHRVIKGSPTEAGQWLVRALGGPWHLVEVCGNVHGSRLVFTNPNTGDDAWADDTRWTWARVATDAPADGGEL